MKRTASTWQLQEAKNRLSDLVRRARTQGPQEITVRGDRTAIVISPEDYERLPVAPGEGCAWLQRLLDMPGRGEIPDYRLDALFARAGGLDRAPIDLSDDDFERRD